VLLITID